MRRNWLLALAFLAAFWGLLRGISSGGLWDPHDVEAAELARRIALHLLGGRGLALPFADNSLPIRADLGRGELPFTSMALGFRAFGLTAWAARLPLTLASIAGVWAIQAAVARLFSPRAGIYAALVLATTPLYCLQGRLLFGEALTFAAFALSWSGLSVACLARDIALAVRTRFAALGGLGLYAGLWCRGAIVSVAVPALAVGVAGLALPRQGAPRVAAALVLGLGLTSLAVGGAALVTAQRAGDYSVFVAHALSLRPTASSFEAPLGDLLHAAFPWSALVPLAFAALGRQDAQAHARSALWSAALGLGLGLFAAGLMTSAERSTLSPGVCCWAVLIGVALHELEVSGRDFRLAGALAAALTLVIAFDLRVNSDKVFSPFGLTGITLPETARPALLLWLGAGLGLAVLLGWLAYEREAPPRRFDWEEYRRVLGTLWHQWRGNLVFAGLVVEAALVGFLLLSALSERVGALGGFQAFGSFARHAAALGALSLPLSPLLPLGAMLLRDLGRALFQTSAATPRVLTRPLAVLLATSTVGSAASAGFYPSLSSALAPVAPFERYRALSRPGERLAVLGQSPAAPRYLGVDVSESAADVEGAFAFLMQDAGRRWLALRKEELPELNQLYRQARGHNVPILDAQSGEILLASNRRLAPEPERNPLEASVRSAAPSPSRPLHAVLGGKLEVLGISLRTASGEPAEELVPTRSYQLTVHYRVREPIAGSWRSFVHIDGLQRRFNADHELLEGRYPTRFWLAGDFVDDTTEVVLGPNFSPGSYRLYFGLFSGDKRLAVSEGRADADRVVAGTLQVR